MDTNIFLLLMRDGMVTGLVYALLGIAALLVFVVTRVLFVPQGEFVAFTALSIVAFEEGRVPGTVGLLVAMGIACAIVRLIRERKDLTARTIGHLLAFELFLPLAIAGVTWIVAPYKPGFWISIPLTILTSVLIGAALYRLVFQALSEASILVLLIAAVGVHLALAGLGLVFFGAEGYRSQPISEGSIALGPLVLTVQDVLILLTTVLLMVALWFYFGRTLSGKALRAAAMNRVGARLVGISTIRTGQIAFGMAAGIGAVSGILIGPMTTIYYDTGFLIGIKGVLAAVLAGLVSYPLTVVAALCMAVVESFSAFWASSYKEVIVFLIVVPALLWRSLATLHTHEEE